MFYKYGKRLQDFFGHFYFYFNEVFCILGALVLAGYWMIIATSALCTSLAIYQSNARS